MGETSRTSYTRIREHIAKLASLTFDDTGGGSNLTNNKCNCDVKLWMWVHTHDHQVGQVRDNCDMADYKMKVIGNFWRDKLIQSVTIY